MDEKWAPVEEAPSYHVSDKGRVKNTKTGRILKGSPNRYGYPSVSVCNKDGCFRREIHRLVATAFVEGRAPGLRVLLVDGNRQNVDATNLKWSTQQEVVDNAVERGTIRKLRNWEVNEDGELVERSRR
jgi:hypothetical protein